jgi:AcrR family transcriptional regulator
MDQTNTIQKRESSDDRRLAIALASKQLIIEKGIEGLRMRDIADRVGINIATLHYHVPSKEALFELVAHHIKNTFAAQSHRRPRTNLSPLRRLRMELEDFRETITDDPELVIIFCEMLDKARRDTRVNDVMNPMHAFWTNQFVEILTAGIADGIFRPNLDPLAGGLLLSGALGDFWRRHPIDLEIFDRLALELVRAVINPNSPDYIDKDSAK